MKKIIAGAFVTIGLLASALPAFAVGDHLRGCPPGYVCTPPIKTPR